MLFEFELRPLDEVIPWVTPSGKSLNWFGLTDGFYRIKAGDQFLFNYTNEIIEYWKQQHPESGDSPKPTWIDYQVVRLWEDVLEMLPYILEPLPDKLSSVLQMSECDFEKWADKASSLFINNNVFYDAISWLGQRHLDSLYLSPGASIKIWSAHDQVHIAWDNRSRKIENIPVWSAQHGIYSLPLDTFLDEVFSFNERLMSAMEERVKIIVKNNGIDSVAINLKQLAEEQEDRKKWLGRALNIPRESSELKLGFDILASNKIL